MYPGIGASPGIYGIFCSANGKVYVGQTINLKKRFSDHETALRHGLHFNGHLQKSFDKYGKQFFDIRVIEECGSDVLSAREIAWIEYYGSANKDRGYNKTYGGEDTFKQTPETRRKIAASLLGKKRASPRDETRRLMSVSQKIRWSKTGEEARRARSEKLSIANKGKKPSENTIAASVAFHTGKPLSDAHKENIRRANLGKKMSPEAIEKTRKFWIGRHHTPEARAKISFAQKNRSPETLEKMSASQKERFRKNPQSKELLNRKSESMKRFWANMPEDKKKEIFSRPKSEETQRKKSEAMKIFWANKKNQKNQKAG
jgi:group I intron endonuclease